MKSGSYIDKLIVFDPSIGSEHVYEFGGPGGSNTTIIDCGPNKRLTGLTGSYDHHINQLNGVCIDIIPTPM